jgi:hypothetical protein
VPRRRLHQQLGRHTLGLLGGAFAQALRKHASPEPPPWRAILVPFLPACFAWDSLSMTFLPCSMCGYFLTNKQFFATHLQKASSHLDPYFKGVLSSPVVLTPPERLILKAGNRLTPCKRRQAVKGVLAPAVLIFFAWCFFLRSCVGKPAATLLSRIPIVGKNAAEPCPVRLCRAGARRTIKEKRQMVDTQKRPRLTRLFKNRPTQRPVGGLRVCKSQSRSDHRW